MTASFSTGQTCPHCNRYPRPVVKEWGAAQGKYQNVSLCCGGVTRCAKCGEILPSDSLSIPDTVGEIITAMISDCRFAATVIHDAGQGFPIIELDHRSQPGVRCRLVWSRQPGFAVPNALPDAFQFPVPVPAVVRAPLTKLQALGLSVVDVQAGDQPVVIDLTKSFPLSAPLASASTAKESENVQNPVRLTVKLSWIEDLLRQE